MSEMEFFHGYFEKSYLKIEPDDTDEFYDLEQEHKCQFVKVNGQLYKFWESDLAVGAYGFSVVAPPIDRHQLMCYWYNGGAEIHEVVEDALKKHLAGLANGRS